MRSRFLSASRQMPSAPDPHVLPSRWSTLAGKRPARRPSSLLPGIDPCAFYHPLTGWHMLAIVSLFFGVIIAVNIALAVAATGTFPGLVVENSYVSSQHYDELLARAREQDKAGWRDNLTVDGGVLRFALSRGA